MGGRGGSEVVEHSRMFERVKVCQSGVRQSVHLRGLFCLTLWPQTKKGKLFLNLITVYQMRRNWGVPISRWFLLKVVI